MIDRRDVSTARALASRDRTPVLASLVYPPHVLYVPPPLIVANMLLGVVLFLIAGSEPLAMVISIPLVHAALAACYLREPYMIGVARAWWLSRRWPASRRTRNRVRFSGNKFVA